MKKMLQSAGRIVLYELRNDRLDSQLKCLGYEVAVLSETGKLLQSRLYEARELRWAREGYKTLIDAQARGVLAVRSQWKPYEADSCAADGPRIIRERLADGPQRESVVEQLEGDSK